MDFAVEPVSTTRKKISLTLTADDVNTAIDKAVAERAKSLVLPGFRKGKVPVGVAEKRLGEEAYAAATQEALDTALTAALAQEKLHPLSGVDLDNAEAVKRNTPFTCTMTFDVLPEITFSTYTDLPVEQERAEVTEKDVDDIIEHIRGDMAELVDLPLARLPQDGDMVDVDYEGFEDGEPVADVKGQHFTLVLGQKQALPDFEALVKTVLPGAENEGTVNFPEDYGHQPLAGKAITMKVKVNSIKTRRLPDVDDALALKAGAETMEKLRASISEHVESNKKQQVRGAAMQKLLDGLLEGQSFDLPETLVESRTRRLLSDRFGRMARAGQQPDEAQRTEMEAEARKQAEEDLKPQVFLMTLARKEGLDVHPQEVEMQIYSMAMRAGQDYQKVSDAYRRSGMVHEIHDRILADKGMDVIYSKAKITEVEPKAE